MSPRLIDLTLEELRAVIREELGRALGRGDWLTVEEAAQLARAHPATVRRRIREGKLAASRRDGTVLVRRQDVDAWIRPEDADLGRLLDMARRGA